MNFRPVRFTLVFCTLFLVFYAFAHRWVGEDGYGWEATVDGDAKGYYAPLPALLIFSDPTFEFYFQPGNEAISRYYNERFRVATDQGTVHKNYSGVAVMQLPFFAGGHLLAKATGEPLNGYSWPYMLMLILGSVFYCIAGLYCTMALLQLFGLSEPVVSMTGLLLTIGTNLLYYTAIHAAMPHVYSFFLIAAFALLVRAYLMSPQTGKPLLAAVVFGLILLVRPVNGLVVLAIPFLTPSFEHLKNGFAYLKNRLVLLFFSAAAGLSVVCLQLAFYKLQTGHWWVWSYGNEGFRFDDPHVIDVLFSFKKGLLIYTPVMFLSFAGIWLLYRFNKWTGLSWFFFITATIYVISSWWSWFYGDGYGLRAFVDYYPLMAVPMAFAVNGIFKLNFKVRPALLLLLPLFLLLSVIQNYQYRYRIIHPAEMNFEKYCYVFLKTGAAYRDVIGGDNEYVYPRLSTVPVATYFNDFENPNDRWPGVSGTNSDRAFSGGKTIDCNGDVFWAMFAIKGSELPAPSGSLFAVVSYQRREHESGACDKAYLACAVSEESGPDLSWKAFRMNEFPQKEILVWRNTEARFRVPENIGPGQILKIYVWNQDKRNFEVDDMKVELFKMNDN